MIAIWTDRENNITSYYKVCNRMLECIWYFLRHFAANPINVPSWTDSSLHPVHPGSKAYFLSHPVETGLLFLCQWHRVASKPWNGTFLLILLMSQRSDQEMGGRGGDVTKLLYRNYRRLKQNVKTQKPGSLSDSHSKANHHKSGLKNRITK